MEMIHVYIPFILNKNKSTHKTKQIGTTGIKTTTSTKEAKAYGNVSRLYVFDILCHLFDIKYKNI